MNEHEHSYAEHQRRKRSGLPNCDGCRAKATEYMREHRRTNPEYRRREQAKNAAYYRALSRLARRHPVEFRELLDEERRTNDDERTRT